MTKDWAAVAKEVRERMQQLDMTQAELVQRSGLAPMTVRELVNDSARRRRSRATLAVLSEALGWPRDYLVDVVEGRRPSDPDRHDSILRELAEIRVELRTLDSSLSASDQVRAISDRLDRIEQRLSSD